MISTTLYRRHSRILRAMRLRVHDHSRSGSLSLVLLSTLLENLYETVHSVRTELGMVKKQKEQKFKWNGYINVDIPDGRRDEAKMFIVDVSMVLEAVEQVVSDGYKISLRRDSNSEGVTATLTCHSQESDNYGHAMSAFAGDVVSALGVVVFKHYRVVDEEWGVEEKAGADAFG